MSRFAVKALPRDGDGDGRIDDGKPTERAALYGHTLPHVTIPRPAHGERGPRTPVERAALYGHTLDDVAQYLEARLFEANGGRQTRVAIQPGTKPAQAGAVAAAIDDILSDYPEVGSMLVAVEIGDASYVHCKPPKDDPGAVVAGELRSVFGEYAGRPLPDGTLPPKFDPGASVVTGGMVLAVSTEGILDGITRHHQDLSTGDRTPADLDDWNTAGRFVQHGPIDTGIGTEGFFTPEHIAEARDRATYAVAVHELGHLLDVHRTPMDDRVQEVNGEERTLGELLIRPGAPPAAWDAAMSGHTVSRRTHLERAFQDFAGPLGDALRGSSTQGPAYANTKNPSGYSEANWAEWWAESFGAWYLGYPELAEANFIEWRLSRNRVDLIDIARRQGTEFKDDSGHFHYDVRLMEDFRHSIVWTYAFAPWLQGREGKAGKKPKPYVNRGYVNKTEARLKKDPKDADGDGMVNDGKPTEHPVKPKAPKAPEIQYAPKEQIDRELGKKPMSPIEGPFKGKPKAPTKAPAKAKPREVAPHVKAGLQLMSDGHSFGMANEEQRQELKARIVDDLGSRMFDANPQVFTDLRGQEIENLKTINSPIAYLSTVQRWSSVHPLESDPMWFGTAETGVIQEDLVRAGLITPKKKGGDSAYADGQGPMKLTRAGEAAMRTAEEGMTWEDYAGIMLDKAPADVTDRDLAGIVAHSLVQQWAVTSSDDHPLAHAIQRRAATKFKVNPPAHHSPEGTKQIDAQMGPAIDVWLDAVYASTQEGLASIGVTGGNVYRGTKADNFEPKLPKKSARRAKAKLAGNEDALNAGKLKKANPLSSWSTNSGIATDFEEGVVLAMEFDAKDVFATCFTGPGCLMEDEIILLGRNGHEVRADPLPEESLGWDTDSEEIENLLDEAFQAKAMPVYNPNAVDADSDGVVQEGTPFKRPAKPKPYVNRGYVNRYEQELLDRERDDLEPQLDDQIYDGVYRLSQGDEMYRYFSTEGRAEVKQMIAKHVGRQMCSTLGRRRAIRKFMSSRADLADEQADLGSYFFQTGHRLTWNEVAANMNQSLPLDMTEEQWSEWYAARLVDLWAETASDSNGLAHMVQFAISENFGGGLAYSDIDGGYGDAELYEVLKVPTDIFVSAVYENTQEALRGPVSLYRGTDEQLHDVDPLSIDWNDYGGSYGHATDMDLLRSMVDQTPYQAEILPGMPKPDVPQLTSRRVTYDQAFELNNASREAHGLPPEDLTYRRVDPNRGYDAEQALDRLIEEGWVVKHDNADKDDEYEVTDEGRYTVRRLMRNQIEVIEPYTGYGVTLEQTNPASSFSTLFEIARGFGTNVIRIDVDPERIWSTAFTGPGCLSELEMIVLGAGQVEGVLAHEQEEKGIVGRKPASILGGGGRWATLAQGGEIPLPRDGDHDGRIYDGTPREQPAPAAVVPDVDVEAPSLTDWQRERIKRNRVVKSDRKHLRSMLRFQPPKLARHMFDGANLGGPFTYKASQRVQMAGLVEDYKNEHGRTRWRVSATGLAYLAEFPDEA